VSSPHREQRLPREAGAVPANDETGEGAAARTASDAADAGVFVPPTGDDVEAVVEEESRHVLANRGFLRLWLAQVISSLGDWIGLIAVLALAQRVSNSGTAVGLVMTARMLPGFLLAPLGGALVDRWDRRRTMVVCDIGRACLLALLPFFDNLGGLILISFMLEVLSLLWGPAKDATVPNVVRQDQLAAANSLGLVAAWGTFPLGGVCFALLAGAAKWLGGFSALDRFSVDQESLAIWVDSLTFVGSALLIMRLKLPGHVRRKMRRVEWAQTYRDMVDGLAFIRRNPMVRGTMVGLAGGLLGGGAMVPLGPAFSRQVLGAGAAGFGVLMTALGFGAGIGVPTLLWAQRRLPHAKVFVTAVAAVGFGMIAVAFVSTLTPATAIVAFVGASAGSAYVTGFTLLQESVSDELRGRIFGALYTIVRLSLLLSLTVGPFMSSAFDAISKAAVDRELTIGSFSVALPGVRLALVAGGGITILSAWAARRRMRRARTEGPAGAIA
jgi:dTMP kinase